jgi:hypothetical protein
VPVTCSATSNLVACDLVRLRHGFGAQREKKMNREDLYSSLDSRFSARDGKAAG